MVEEIVETKLIRELMREANQPEVVTQMQASLEGRPKAITP